MKLAQFCMVLIVSACALPIAAQDSKPGILSKPTIDADRLAKLKPTMERYCQKGTIHGIVTIVAHKGKVDQHLVVGKRAVNSELPMNESTIFSVAQMTRPVTSVALMTLWEQKKFKLDDPIEQYLPVFKNLMVRDPDTGKLVKPNRVPTIRDLMLHTAGFAYDYKSEDEKVGFFESAKSLQEIVAKIAKRPLIFHPGEKWSISVAGDIQGRLIEVLSGQPYEKAVSDRVLRPLGMIDSCFHVPREKRTRAAVAHFLYKGKLVPATTELDADVGYAGGDGGLWATVGDFHRFCQMLLNGGRLGKVRILRESTIAMMTQNQLPKKLLPLSLGTRVLKTSGYGFGFKVELSAKGKNGRPKGTFGCSGGASTMFFVSPKEKLIGLAFSQVLPYSEAVLSDFERVVFRAAKVQ